MRLIIVPGPIAKVHATDCGYAKRVQERGSTEVTRIQGARADRMLDALSEISEDDALVTDGANGLPKGYFRACRTCKPVERG